MLIWPRAILCLLLGSPKAATVLPNASIFIEDTDWNLPGKEEREVVREYTTREVMNSRFVCLDLPLVLPTQLVHSRTPSVAEEITQTHQSGSEYSNTSRTPSVVDETIQTHDAVPEYPNANSTPVAHTIDMPLEARSGMVEEGRKAGGLSLRDEKVGSQEEHPDMLTGMINLASMYVNQRRWNEAERLQVQVLEATKRDLGEEHPDTLVSMANLASTYWNQGRWKEAEKLQVEVSETRMRDLGEEHPDTLTSMANLATTYSNQGRWKEAEQLQVHVSETRKRILGEEHPDTLTSMANLVSTYKNQGRWKEAEQLEVQVLESRNSKIDLPNLAAL